jgi:glycogen operon protein
LGPTLSLRGVDNVSYYRLVADNPRFYVDYTAAATAEHAPPRVLQSIMDSLRY